MAQFKAAERGDLTLVRQLVNINNVNEKDALGRTVLHYTCVLGSVAVLDYILGLKVDVNTRDNLGRVPLYLALLSRSTYDCYVKRLLAAGADASIPSYYGTISLHLVHKSVEIMTLLLAAYPNGVFAVKSDGETPLHMVARYGTLDCCCLLLDAGSIVDTVNSDGRTPLSVALCVRNKDIAECLLDHGARLELVKVGHPISEIPEWGVFFVAQRKACAKMSTIITSLRKPGMDPHLFKLLGKYVWHTRRNDKWGK